MQVLFVLTIVVSSIIIAEAKVFRLNKVVVGGQGEQNVDQNVKVDVKQNQNVAKQNESEQDCHDSPDGPGTPCHVTDGTESPPPSAPPKRSCEFVPDSPGSTRGTMNSFCGYILHEKTTGECYKLGTTCYSEIAENPRCSITKACAEKAEELLAEESG